MRDPRALSKLAEEIHATAREKGWYDKPRDFSITVANLHSEATEAWGHYVDGRGIDEVFWTATINEHSTPEQVDVYHQMKEMAALQPVGEELTSQAKACGLLKPDGVPVEVADLMIRCLDFFHEHGLNPDQVVRDKMTYNSTRPYRHGGKRA